MRGNLRHVKLGRWGLRTHRIQPRRRFWQYSTRVRQQGDRGAVLIDPERGSIPVSTSIQSRVIPSRSSTTTCRGCMLWRRRTRGQSERACAEPPSRPSAWRSGATRLDGDEHERTLSESTASGLPQDLVVDRGRENRTFRRAPTSPLGGELRQQEVGADQQHQPERDRVDR